MDESPPATCVPADYNLRNWATIAYTATLWNKSKIAPLFDEAQRMKTSAYIHKMVKEQEKVLESANFPRKISDEILCLFKTMGQRIALWCVYATEVLDIKKEVIPTVCWTVYGTIDEAKILQNVTNLINIENELILPLEAVYYTACSNVSIDFIQLHWKEMLKFCEIYSREADFLGQTPAEPRLRFIASSVIFLAKVELSELFPSQVKYVESFECNKTEGMFWMSLREGCPKAVRYYWGLLSESQRTSFITYAADCALREYSAGEKYDFFNRERSMIDDIFSSYPNKCFADLFIFFLTIISENELWGYLWDLKTQGMHFIFTTLDVLMCHWPLEEFLPLAFHLTLKYCDDLNDCKVMINRLMDVIHMNKDFGLDDKSIFHRKLFINLWEKLKTFISWEELFDEEKPLLDKICSVFESGVFKFLINDCEEIYRGEFITYCGPVFKNLLGTHQYELVKKFRNDVLISEYERIWFEDTCLRYWDGFIKEFRLDVVDHLLDLSERVRFTNDFQYMMSLCGWFISNNRIQLANKSIKWMFKSAQEKDEYVSNCFTSHMNWVLYIWKTNEKKFTENLSRFLMWLLESQGEVNRFKTEKLLSQHALLNLFAALFELEKSEDGYQRGSVIFKIIDEFLLFCADSNLKKVKLLKHQIREKFDKWMLFLSEKCCLHRVDDFINYIFENEEEKTMIKRVSVIHRANLKAAGSAWAKCNREVLKSWKGLTDISEKIVTDCRYIYFVRTIDGVKSIVDLIPSTKSLWLVSET